jgi:hypothetical protein
MVGMRPLVYIATLFVAVGIVITSMMMGTTLQSVETARLSAAALKAPTDDWTRKRER